MKDPVEEADRIRDERMKYKQLIRIRSNSRETEKPQKCILLTPFDEVPPPRKKKSKHSKNSTCHIIPKEYRCPNKTSTKVILTKSLNSINDCGCVAENTRRPKTQGTEIIDPREKLKCVKKKCEQTEECKEKLKTLLREIEKSAEKLKALEKLKRKGKNYNSNCDTIRSRNLRK